MPLIETTGAASSRGFGQFARPVAANYIEDVFQTWLYAGNGSTQTITNGVDLSGKGGLVWIKNRTSAVSYGLYDTNRGAYKWLASNLADAETTQLQHLTAFNNNGFSLGSSSIVNVSGADYTSWTFREQPKFFDVVTYTGNGSNRTISHSLGSVPGCIIVKRTDTAADWQVYHRSLANTEYMVLNDTAAKATGTTRWNSTTPTATEFSLGTDTTVNANSGTYVAYLFAHDAGGFGASGTDNVISCGSYYTDGATTTIDLGWEPQWILWKYTNQGNSSANWRIVDNMRGWTAGVGGPVSYLNADVAAAEAAVASAPYFNLTSTGFTVDQWGLGTYIYIAIRRGPMRTPTTGTSVFTPTLTSATTGTAITVGFPIDSHWANYLAGDGNNTSVIDRLRGLSTVSGTNTPNTWLKTSGTDAESIVAGPSAYLTGTSNTGWVQGSYASGASSVRYNFRRAPGFFDVVCYTGDGFSGRIVQHNLGAVPQLVIYKSRSNANAWGVYTETTGTGKALELNNTAAAQTATSFATTAPTASYLYTGTDNYSNQSGATYVAYLFATVAGVSKVGSYTGTGTTLQVNCGFTGGARFVLIKRTDSTGDWYVWDSARGIVAGNDPYLLLNSTAAEVTNTDYVDTFSSGFEISSTAPAAINANGGTFIFLAVA